MRIITRLEWKQSEPLISTITTIISWLSERMPVTKLKVIITLVAAMIYLLKGKDLIPDNFPVVGYVDDLAVFAADFLIDEPELTAYSQWREEKA